MQSGRKSRIEKKELSEQRTKNLRIAQVVQRYSPYIGGLETHVKEMSERLVMKGFELEVLTTDPSGRLPKEDMVNGLRVRRFKAWAPGEAYYFSNGLKKYLARNASSYDVVHAHAYHSFPALYAAETKGKNKLFFTPHYHGKGHTFFRNLLLAPYKLMARKLFERADRLICVSRYERGLIMKNFEVDESRVSVIPNGVTLEEFKNLEKEKKGYRSILCVARLEKYKGIDFLVKVLPELSGDVQLDIVGKGPYKKSLIKLVKNLNLEHRVSFSESLSRKELLQKYANADLFALLSKYEAYGISVAEALASRTPSIVANTSALQEWVDNKNCFGLNYPIKLDELIALVNQVIGRRVDEVHLPDWNENAEKLAKLYLSC